MVCDLTQHRARRVYEPVIRDFMRFARIAQPEECLRVTCAHVIVWRDNLLVRSPAARRFAAVNSSCDESLIQHIFAALDERTFVVLDATYCFMSQRMLDRTTGRRVPPDSVRRLLSQPIASLLLSTKAHQDLRQRGVHTIGDRLPHAYE